MNVKSNSFIKIITILSAALVIATLLYLEYSLRSTMRGYTALIFVAYVNSVTQLNYLAQKYLERLRIILTVSSTILLLAYIYIWDSSALIILFSTVVFGHTILVRDCREKNWQSFLAWISAFGSISLIAWTAHANGWIVL